jgi:predicted small secreted protein
MKRALAAIFSIAFMGFFITGCSTMRIVDSDVTAFSRWSAAPPGPGTPYRFERLPSQQAVGNAQDLIEGQARTALAKVGMELNPSAARYSVQVLLSNRLVDRSPYGGGYDGFGGFGGFGFGGPGVFLGGGNRGAAFGLSFPLGFSEAYYKRELSIFMRDLSSNQVVFESHAVHDGVWSDTLGVLPAMFDSALSGFPQPPPGTRRMNVEIPR